jgi:hypothetical protein
MSETTTKSGVLHDRDRDGGTELDVFVFEDRDETNGSFLQWASRYVATENIACDWAAPASFPVAAAVARRMVEAGYCVYDGVNYFCIYAKGHCS